MPSHERNSALNARSMRALTGMVIEREKVIHPFELVCTKRAFVFCRCTKVEKYRTIYFHRLFNRLVFNTFQLEHSQQIQQLPTKAILTKPYLSTSKG